MNKRPNITAAAASAAALQGWGTSSTSTSGPPSVNLLSTQAPTLSHPLHPPSNPLPQSATTPHPAPPCKKEKKPDAPLPPTYVNKTGFKSVVPPGSKKSFVICLGDDPSDIAKWREERRKKWPSRENVAEKLKAGIVPSANKPMSSDNRRTCNYFLKNGKCSKGDTCTFKHDQEAHDNYKRVGEKREKDRADQLETFGEVRRSEERSD
ncbi:hypothetical protein TrLO_g1370 [Triparma laevis f. longispina]|uniref:C3H1-type domain-containing protein n=1 Tax=Triparma laevis f. longispina TaxID=1714387 RepID=A0A9W7FTS7_9STRA|nr:hypothetical protein TrLO_g1370 [Triparma laevis f. longispina]